MSKTPPHIVEKIRAARERSEAVIDLKSCDVALRGTPLGVQCL